MNTLTLSKAIRIQEALDNAEANINYLASLPDRALAEKLDTVHLQMKLAEEKKNTAAIELLEVWRSQIIEARIYKAENNIADAPNEIELAIAGIETVVATTEERQEIIKDFEEKIIPSRSKTKTQENNDNQLSMF